MTISQLEKEGYEGPDVSLNISLFEYGIVWKLTSEEQKEYRFIVGVGLDKEGNYNRFDWFYLNEKDFDSMQWEDWFEHKKVMQSCGSGNPYLSLSMPYGVQYAIMYHGYENIFGTSCDYFEIEGGDE